MPSVLATLAETSITSPASARKTPRTRRFYRRSHSHSSSTFPSASNASSTPEGSRRSSQLQNFHDADQPSPANSPPHTLDTTVFSDVQSSQQSARQAVLANLESLLLPTPPLLASEGRARMMARGRGESASTGDNGARTPSDHTGSNLAGQPKDEMPTIKFIPYQDPRSTRPSLAFPATARTLPHEDCVIRVGRYSERDTNPNPPPNTPSSAPVGFKSKVVSRRHCEFWCSQGQWYIKDVKSSSGTFLNHIRLSNPSVESKPFPVHDGDMVQLGIDFRGGEEMIFRCVKIKVECNRAWQKTLNNYNVTTHKRLRDLGKPKDPDTASSNSSECSICLMSIAPCQSLFVAPCSHVWHYKCIRRCLNDEKFWPIFLCPNCRARHDLDADVDDIDVKDWEEVNGGGSSPEISPAQGSQVEQLEETRGNFQQVMDGDEDGLSCATSRNLSIQETNATSSPSPSGDSSSIGPNASNASIISRRGARRISPPFSPTNEQSAGRYVPGTAQYLRPMTPTQPLPGNGPMDESSLRTPNAEFLMQDGPMTPTNNAGPFVFDGSAGRSEEQRVPAVSLS